MNISYKVSSQMDNGKHVYSNKLYKGQSLKVEDIMTREVITLKPDEDLNRAEEIMRRKAIKHLPVVDDEGRLIGLLTDNDLLESVCSSLTGMGKCNRDDLLSSIRVSEIMRGGVITTRMGNPLRAAAREMLSYHINSLPVLDDDDVLRGIITETDFVEYFANSKYN